MLEKMGDENTVVDVKGVTYSIVEVESILSHHAKEIVATCIGLKGKYMGHKIKPCMPITTKTTIKLLIPFNKLNVFWEETKHLL